MKSELSSIAAYLEHCRSRDVPFALPGSDEALTPEQFYREVAGGSALGLLFAAHWGGGVLPRLRGLIDDRVATPNPEARYFPPDPFQKGDPARWLSTWDLYWEIVRGTEVGGHYRQVWAEMRFTGAAAPPSEVTVAHEPFSPGPVGGGHRP
ncbi:MAG: hypothetical protein ACRC33_05645 [Gemmataceae bacterium]